MTRLPGLGGAEPGRDGQRDLRGLRIDREESDTLREQAGERLDGRAEDGQPMQRRLGISG